ncbi:hypothetical protein MKY64_07925 [Paenibacillus sp. FSL R7-0210]|uniref:hypothetical protein n=1 Tax=Paenibacillus sp. FSL R7-0210 TaxID=2921676 RepID=UPI0030F7C20A
MDVNNIYILILPYVVTLVTGAIGGQILNHLIIGKRERVKLKQQKKYKFYLPLYSLINLYFERSTSYRADTYKKNITSSDNREEILRIIEANIDYANGEVLEAFYLVKNLRYYTDIDGAQERELEHQLFYKILKGYYIMENKRLDIKITILFFQIYLLTLNMKLPNPHEALTNKSLMDRDKLGNYYSLSDFEKIMVTTYERKEFFLKKLLERVSIDNNKNNLINHFFVRSLNLVDPKEHDNKKYIFKILNDQEVGDVSLSVFNRQYLRSQILNDICFSYFYKQGKEFKYYKKEYDSLPREKKLAFEYFEDGGLIKITRQENLISIKPTIKAIDDYEKYLHNIKVIRK